MSIQILRRHVIIPPNMGVNVMTPRTSAATAAWWVVPGKTAVAAYCPKGAASLAASYSNLAQPGTYDAAPGSAPGWNATDGWISDGTKWLDTGVNAAGGWSMLVRFAGDGGVCGDSSSASDRFAVSADAGNWIWYLYGANFSIAMPSLDSGVIGLAGGQGYRNGLVDGAAIAAWSGATAGTIRLLTVAGWGNLIGSIQAFCLYSDTLSAPQVATVSAAMAAL